MRIGHRRRLCLCLGGAGLLMFASFLVGPMVGQASAETLKEALNAAYEERFGFRFVVFVNRRPRAEIVPVLRERLQRTRDEELATGCGELVAIAVDRWRTS